MKTCAWLTVAAGAALAVPALAIDHPEAEPNDTLPTATSITMAPGDVLRGTSTGSNVGLPNNISTVDYFRVRTTAASLGVYRCELTLTSPVFFHGTSLRGSTQNAGGILTGSNHAFQSGYSGGGTTSLVRWYGFGLEEQVYYRVDGASHTTSPYSATLTRTAVTPTVLPTVLAAGQYTVRTTLAGSTTDPDIWVYNRDTMQPIAGFGNDDTPSGTVGGSGAFSTLTRTFGPGRYLLVVGDANTGNNLPSPADDAWRLGTVMDFPNVIANEDTENPWTARVIFNAGPNVNGADAADITLPPTALHFELRFLAFDVASPCAADVGVQGGTAGQDGLLNNNDFIVFIAWFFAADPRADVGRQGGIAPGDGLFNNNDFVVYINLFFAGC